ncbi:MAG: NAD-dependent epimerase/dehydratase family protein, partial [Pseudolabrys sp.]
MHIMMTGAAGMIGRKLTARLVKDGKLNGQPIDRLTLIDVVAPEKPAGFNGTVELTTTDLAAPGAADLAVAGRPDVIFHLAGVVSGEAETDFEKGYHVNLDGTRALLEAIRAVGGYKPKVVFTSSIAVYGAPFPYAIPDEFHLTPLTSYGTQKAISELLLADYNRRGFLDGVGIRLPTICVRPGKPNKAASGFFSNIIREPLAGLEAVLPVLGTVRHTHASPRAAVGFLIHAA